jgi:hypothetical protein
MARRRRSSNHRGSDLLLPAPLRMARPPFLRDSRVAGSLSRIGCDGGGSSGGGLRREGLQGALVVAPLRATTFPRCGRCRLRRLDLLFAPLWNLVIAGSGTARGRYDQVRLEKAKLQVRGEMGDALGSEHAQYLKKSSEGDNPPPPRRFSNHSRIVCHRGGWRNGSWEELMGHTADVCQPTSHDDSGSYDGGDSEVKMTRLATGALCRPPCGDKTQSGTSSKEAVHRLAAASRVTSWNRFIPRWPRELREI